MNLAWRAEWRSAEVGRGALLLSAFLALPLGAQETPKPPATEPPKPGEMVQAPEGLGPTISQGWIPVIQFLTFIQLTTGKPVFYPSTGGNDQAFKDAIINVLGDIQPLNYEVARALLIANGFELYESVIDDGRVVINVSHISARQKQTGPETTAVLQPGVAPKTTNTEELVTLVVQLEYADTNVVSNALRDLFGLSQRPQGNNQLIPIPNTSTLILKGKYGFMRHVEEIIRVIDRDIPPLPQILEVIPILNADAQELVSTISEVLNVAATVTGSRRSRVTAAPAAGGAGGAPARTQAPTQPYTRLIADVRTQKIIVDSTNENDVELVKNLVEELDAKVDFYRANTHVYRVKFLKAADLAEDITALVEGTRSTGGLSRSSTRSRRDRRTGDGGVTTPSGQPTSTGQQPTLATRIVPHDETNSLLIQADLEEYNEILNVLQQIDRKRRQVFLEVALVNVNDASSLNYTIEYLAGTLDDEATRAAALSAFGLTTIDPTTLPGELTRVFSESAPTTGLFGVVSHNGQLPVILRAIKTDTESEIVATPFILADDNQENTISVQTEVFFNTSTLNNSFSQTDVDAEEAGVTLTLIPTISEEVVLLELSLEVSAFGGASSGDGALPDKNRNTVESRVTIADNELFIIGGLARAIDSLAVSKIPILGDLPLIGRLFQSRSSDRRRDNLYVFLTCQIINEDSSELSRLTSEARSEMSSFSTEFTVQKFKPKDMSKKSDEAESSEDGPEPAPVEDPGAAREEQRP